MKRLAVEDSTSGQGPTYQGRYRRCGYWSMVGNQMEIAAAHLANVAPDLEDDLATGVRGLPHRLGAVPSAILGASLLFGASLVLALGPEGAPTGLGIAVLVVAVPAVVVAALAGSARFRRLAFPAVMLLTVLDVVLLLAGGTTLT